MLNGRTRASRADAWVLLAALLWSTGGLGVKSVDMTPLALAGFRSAFAIPVLALAAFVEARRHDAGVREFLGPMLRRPLVWAAAASYAVMVVSFVVAAKLTTAANAILLQYTGPIYVALLSWPLLREKLRAIDVVATAGCVVGMILFFFDRVSPEGRVGDLVAIVSSFGFAGVPLLMRLEQRRHPATWRAEAASPMVAMILGNVVACVACAPFMLEASAKPLGPAGWSVLVFLGAVQIGVAYWLYGSAVGKMPALRSTLLATIEPILNPLWVALVRGEKPSRWAAVGGAVILVSVTLQSFVKARAAR
ncbi:MAG TPA: DMT family transporter [Polyangiaceae bacterium]|jgi:drug/metabolite transporter (DMT)-like permease